MYHQGVAPCGHVVGNCDPCVIDTPHTSDMDGSQTQRMEETDTSRYVICLCMN